MHPPLTLCRWRNVQQQFPDTSNYAPPQRPDEWPLWWVQCVALTARGTDSFALRVWKNKTVYTTQAASRHFTFWIGLDDAFFLMTIMYSQGASIFLTGEHSTGLLKTGILKQILTRGGQSTAFTGWGKVSQCSALFQLMRWDRLQLAQTCGTCEV